MRQETLSQRSSGECLGEGDLHISSQGWFYSFHSRYQPQHVNLWGVPAPQLARSRRSPCREKITEVSANCEDYSSVTNLKVYNRTHVIQLYANTCRTLFPSKCRLNVFLAGNQRKHCLLGLQVRSHWTCSEWFIWTPESLNCFFPLSQSGRWRQGNSGLCGTKQLQGGGGVTVWFIKIETKSHLSSQTLFRNVYVIEKQAAFWWQ